MMSFPSGPARTDQRQRVALLSFSPIADDPRVRRQGDLLAENGWDVTAFGLSGAVSPAPKWPIIVIDGAISALSSRPPQIRKATVVKLIPGRIRNAFWLFLARLGPTHATRAYWNLKPYFRTMAEQAESQPFDLVIANDWPALGVGLQLSQKKGAALIYDTHEFATDEYGHRGLWRLFYQPFLRIFEGEGARQAQSVTCVSDGIADALQKAHAIIERPVVIRNMPMSFAVRQRALGETIRVLYHGIITPGRGLEACIESVALWPKDYTLTIQGPGAAEYCAALQSLALKHGVEERVIFAPPVPMTELVRVASQYDIGLFAMPGNTVQSRFVLPNKFFEYVGAGLALCVSDLPEMQRLLQQHDLGSLITGDNPADIAQAIARLDRMEIMRFKNNAAEAAKTLCWERESQKLLALCKTAIEAKEARTP